MYRFVSSVSVIITLGILVSCSGSGTMAGKSGQSQAASKVQKYPSWYPEHSVVNTDTVMYAYATTIDEDSASAVDKAVAWAKSEMQSSLSDKLENIRSDAVRELGSDSGLDSPGFLIALRHADDVVQNLAQTGNAEVKTVEGYNSYRGFAEIKVAKDKLIDEIGKRLGGHEKAWNAMKESKAFQNF